MQQKKICLLKGILTPNSIKIRLFEALKLLNSKRKNQ